MRFECYTCEKIVPIYDAACSLVSSRLREARYTDDAAAERKAADALERLDTIFREYLAELEAHPEDSVLTEHETARRIRTLSSPFARIHAPCDTVTDTLLFLELAGGQCYRG